jgi:hypothetical protein
MAESEITILGWHATVLGVDRRTVHDELGKPREVANIQRYAAGVARHSKWVGWLFELTFTQRPGEGIDLIGFQMFPESHPAAIVFGLIPGPDFGPHWGQLGVHPDSAADTAIRLGARTLHDLPLGAIEIAMRAELTAHTAKLSQGKTIADWDDPSMLFQGWSDALAQRPGRRGHGLLVYAQLAAEYVEIFESGSAQPVRDLAARRGKSEGLIRGMLEAARRKELLTRAGQGKAGGALRQKAIDLLAAESARA